MIINYNELIKLGKKNLKKDIYCSSKLNHRCPVEPDACVSTSVDPRKHANAPNQVDAP